MNRSSFLRPGRSAAALVAGLFLGSALLSAQQAVSITGKVTDGADGHLLSGARVQVIGTNFNGSSNLLGTYNIRGVPPGSYNLRVIMLGYRSNQKPVTVAAGQATTVDWPLTAVPFTLEEIVTTATGEQLTRELGNSVAKVQASELVKEAPVTNVSELLNGRIAGVTVIANDGIAGSGSRIRIRGISSVTLSSDPLLYVDGIRVSERGPALTVSNGGNSPSFFNDLKPEEIESIEIVKGPSAATLYGTQAANGVIRITTKRGKAGAPQWNFYSEQGAVHDPSEYLPVYFSQGSDNSQCLVFQQALGQCTIKQLYSRNIMKDASTTPLQDAYRWQYGASVSGGTDASRYFVSAALENQNSAIKMPNSEVQYLDSIRGVSSIPENQLNPNYLRRISLRANLSSQLSSKADVSLSSGFINGDNQIPQTGDNLEGVFAASTYGTANPLASSPFGFARPAYGLSHLEYRKSNHFINSANLNFRPFTWLSTRGTTGLDYLGFEDQELARNGEACPFCGFPSGVRTLNRFQSYKYSVDLGATATFKLTNRIGSKTSVGAQYNKDNLTASNNQGSILPPGGETFTGAANKVSSELTTQFITLGTYVEQQISFDDRLFVTGALRIDKNSAFGADFRSAKYPKIQASFVVREQREKGLLNALRLRSAYGVSGVQPGPLDAITYFNGVTASAFGTNVPAVSIGGLANASLKPERSAEVEAGFEATIFSNKVNIDATYYNKRTTDALVQRPLPGSLGAVAAQTENVGTVSNKGLELSVQVRPIESKKVVWDLQLEFAYNKNALVALASGVPAPTGFGYRQAVGYPLYGIWWPKMISYSDADHNGVITPNEITATDTAVFAGNTIPTKTLSLNSSLSLFKNRIRIGTQLEYKGGFSTLDVNTLFQCDFVQNCQALNDPHASLFDQARALSGVFGDYAEDASFVRLRELSVTYTFPADWARALRAANASLTLTGRNLHLWKSKSLGAWDPETNTAAGVAQDGPNYNFVQPGQPRLFLVRLNLTF